MVSWIRFRWKILLLLLVLIGGIGYWQYSSRQAAQKKKLTFEHPQVRTIKQELEVSGKVDAKEKAVLKFLAGGKLTYIGAKEGDTVKKWQTLASIDVRDLQKTLAKNLNLYAIQRSTVDQNLDSRKNIHGNYSTDQLNKQDQFTLENTVTTVEIQDLAIKNSSLYSPLAGVLISAPTQVAGTVVTASDAFTVINPNSMVFIANVDETDISKVKEGMMATIKLDAYAKTEIPAKVGKISYQSSEASTGTVFEVEFVLPSSITDVTYRLGMNGSVRILLDQKDNVLSVPNRAIIEREGKTYVEVQDGSKTKTQEVSVGLENDEDIEILNGVTASDSVLVR